MTGTISEGEASNVSSPPREVTDPAPLSIVAVLLRLHRSWRVIVPLALVAGALVVGFGLMRPRKFEATAQLATISASSLSSSTPSIVAALGGLQGMGVVATPALIVELSRTNAVLINVGASVSPEMGGRRLVDLLADRETGQPVPDELIPETVRARLVAGANVQTGLIRFAITHHDSAVARRALIKLVDEVNKAYLAASHAQARAIAAAQGTRVDSAAARLARADLQLLDFVRGNRSTQSYSESALGRTRLERERDFAQSVYSLAVTSRDAAVGRALEETPALIVVDPVPAKLKPVSRGLAAKGLLTMMAVLALSLIWTLGKMRLESMAGSDSLGDRRLAALFRIRRSYQEDLPRARGS